MRLAGCGHTGTNDLGALADCEATTAEDLVAAANQTVAATCAATAANLLCRWVLLAHAMRVIEWSHMSRSVDQGMLLQTSAPAP